MFEFLFVCALSLAISAAYINLANGPILTLLFDGFGYLTVTQGCMSSFNADLLAQVWQYCLSGFDEQLRGELLQKLAPAGVLVRSGPLLPLLLSTSFLVSGKPPSPQFWSVACWAMWLTQSLTLGGIWLTTRLAFNANVARIAAILALTYGAFIINGNRTSTESQACLGVVLTSLLFVYYGAKGYRQPRKLADGLACGIALGFLALARPPFLLLPIIIAVAMFVAARKIKQSLPFSRRWFAGVICGAVLFLAPWALCNKILTNKASIAIDRYAVYNLYTGLNTKTLGLDTLPSEFVEHPERFKMPLAEALKIVKDNALADPAHCFEMLVLKPARLLDAPWNDCQVSCFGIPWLALRYLHQLLLLLAFVGLCSLWRRATREPDWSTITPAIVFTSILSYNLIHCLFISMGRYTYPVMPVFIIAAALGIQSIWQESCRRSLVLGALLLVPLFSFLIESFSAPELGIVSKMAATVGIGSFAFLAASVIFASLTGFVYFTCRQMNFGSRGTTASTLIASVCSIFAALATYYGVRQIAYPIECRAGEKIAVSVPVPEGAGSVMAALGSIEGGSNARSLSPKALDQWFVVVDPALYGFSLDALQSLRFAVNGQNLVGDLFPLLMLDVDGRSSAVYVKAFSHCGRKDVTAIPQWYAVAVPANLVKMGVENKLEMWREAKPSLDNCSAAAGGGQVPPVFLMCDILDNGKAASVALRDFSWSKGFAINAPLDMRMPAGETEKEATGEAKGTRIRPRLSLVRVADPAAVSGAMSGECLTAPIGEKDLIKLGDINLQRGNAHSVVTVPIGAANLVNTIGSIKSGAGNAMRVKVSGEVTDGLTGTSGKVGKQAAASVALLASIKLKDHGKNYSSDTMAPLAPELIVTEGGGRQFYFLDLIPVLTDSDGKALAANDSLPEDLTVSLKVLVSGKPWWDVLQYARYGVNGNTTVKNLTVEVSATRLPQLGARGCCSFSGKSQCLR